MLAWTQSYLASRPFHVKVGGEISKQFKDISGVPQGSSNSEPLQFILFINDIGKAFI